MKKIIFIILCLYLLSCNTKKETQLNNIDTSCFSKDFSIKRTVPNINSKIIIDKKNFGNNVYKKNEDLKIEFKGFNLIFKNINSIETIEDDFEITNTNDSIYIKRKYLESDELYNKKITVESEEIDSLGIKGIYYNDFIFTGQEKMKTPLELNIIDSLYLNFENGFFLPYRINDFKPIVSEDIIERSKCINIKYYRKVSSSDNYGESDKAFAIKSIDELTKNEYSNLNNLFIEYDNIKFILKITYFIKNKKSIKIITYYND